MTDQNKGKEEGPKPATSGMGLFGFIAKYPALFCLSVPIVLTIITAVGFNRDDYVEDSVGEIWIPKGDQLAQNKEYLESINKPEFTSTSFAAMSIARDGGNLFTESRLEEIRQRLDAVENLKIDYNGEEYTWEDICARSGLGPGTQTTYQFPCARFSPLDLFQETRSSFQEIDRLTWYRGVVKGSAIRPRILRFGILQQACTNTPTSPGPSDACNVRAGLRTNPDFAEMNGYPREYANPLGLIGDVGSLELNDPCRICIEESLEAQMNQLENELIKPFFGVLTVEFRKYQANITGDDAAKMGALADSTEKIAASVTRKDVEDFYYYQVVRSTYAALGAGAYQGGYNQLITPETLPIDCTQAPCPKFNISMGDATAALLNHADNTFSSVTTAGSPFPIWSEADGTGTMFAGVNPVGGSGVDMSANLFSIVAYMDLPNYGTTEWTPLFANGFADPLTPDPNWDAMVETNPIYAWFMAAETPITSHCGNGDLTGSATGEATMDGFTSAIAVSQLTQKWCTKYNTPFEADGPDTKQHFARMWYDLLLDSDGFLSLTQGEDDPYTWTLGAGCGYSLGGERDSYTGKSELDILGNASRELYYVDEGVSVGVIDRNLLLGDVSPGVGKYDFSNPLQKVGVMQSLLVALGEPEAIVDRVKNCNRPNGPTNITTDEAEEILKNMKEEFDNVWSKGWNDDNFGEVQFVSFSDDVGAVGTTGIFLREITLSNGVLTSVSIIIIAIFSVFLMFSLDPVQSKITLTLVGVALVILSYFSALGFSIILGIKVNVATAWSLPFILIGLGVDDMYIVLLALKKEKDYTEEGFKRGMKEVVVPVSMTSLVNASMFAIMNISDVPAVYLTARVALISVCFLYISIIFSFSSFCWLDMKRQKARKHDVLFWIEVEETDEGESGNKCVGTWLSSVLYDKFFHPLLLKESKYRIATNLCVWVVAALMFFLAIYGITERQVGLGLEDFFPSDHQANKWAKQRTESLGSWSIGMHWGELNYSDANTQMKMIKQFEGVVAHPNIAELDTKQLWMASFVVWTSRQCDGNVARGKGYCGQDQVFAGDNSTCVGTWKENEFGLRTKIFDDGKGSCQAYEGGICRPTSQMHPADLVSLNISAIDESTSSWCPVFEGWSEDKLGFCLKQWRFLAGGGGSLLLKDEHGTETQCAGEYYNNEEVSVPLLYSGGPTMFAFDLLSHEDTTKVIEDTRAICDNDDELHCWLAGIPFNYWSQYIGIFGLLLQIGGSSVAVGFCVAALFLFASLTTQGRHTSSKVAAGGLVGAFCITTTTILSLVTVVGLSTLAGVNLTGFSIISFVLSVGFSVEYSVHVVSRWLHAPLSIESAPERVHYSMEFLMLPTFMSFISSTIGVVCLAFTQFEFTQVYFFRPLIIVMPITYFYGCWFLPVFLSILDFDFVKFGESEEDGTSDRNSNSKVDDNNTKEATTTTGWQPDGTDGHVSTDEHQIGDEHDC